MRVPHDWEATPQIQEFLDKKFKEELQSVQVLTEKDIPVNFLRILIY